MVPGLRRTCHPELPLNGFSRRSGTARRISAWFPASDVPPGFPYYVNTYGIHGIHGRAAAIGTGVKIANPRLSVWIATGDGDSLAIGGNHFIHIIRRNVDVNIILFNNQIYGLTKGQYSPTTPMGKVTKTSPQGTIEHPFNVGELVMGAQGTFFARVPDNNINLMTEAMFEAAKHDGTSVMEILQNCIIFADKAHFDVIGKEVKDENMLILKNGEPMLFGKNKEKGLDPERYQARSGRDRKERHHPR